ncbi:hypothetical protein R1flu_021370 [Riccia fluitans]|uniref:Sister chromatid cohesion protein DCC1 n=1 Tax=Riccia fluitans TaxID=41844 RepID=A0ABD1ZQB2_9MARC
MISALNLDRGQQVSVKYAENFTSEEPYKLLEVDEAILQELLENGLTIKGAREDEAVLCTSEATYAMKFVSTSNTVLLVPPSKAAKRVDDDVAKCDFMEEGEEESKETDVGVVATASGHIELVEVAPNMEKLKALVSERPFRDDEMSVDYEDDEGNEYIGRLYTWDELSASIQASDRQLKEELKKLGAAEIGKYWRTIDPGYMHNLLEILLSTAIQDDWSFKALRESVVLRRLEADGFPPQVVLSCLETFGIRVHPSGEDSSTSHGTASVGEDTPVWALDEGRICGQYAKVLFSAKPKWRMDDFMEEWRVITPSWMTPHIDMLRGEALVEKVGMDTWLDEFSSSLLPTRPDARFSALFRRRSKWEWEDLEPYFRDLKIPGQSLEAMLLKYTRKSQPTPTSTPVYTAR